MDLHICFLQKNLSEYACQTDSRSQRDFLCTDAEILRRICQLTLTRITHQGSHMIDLNVKKKNRRVKRLISLHIEKKKDKMNSREHQYS